MFYGDDTFSFLVFRGVRCAGMKKWLTRFPKLTMECCRLTDHPGMLTRQCLKKPKWNNQKQKFWLPVSGMTCKELGSHPSYFHSKRKSWTTTTKKSNPLDPTELWGPPKLERQTRGCRESWLPKAEAEAQEHQLEPIPSQKNFNCNRQIPGDSLWTSLRVKNSKGPPVLGGGGGGYFCELNLQEPYQFSQWRSEKKTHASSRGKGKSSHFEQKGSILFFLTRPALERNYLSRA